MLLLALAAPASADQSSTAARDAAAGCMGCHGPDGRSTPPIPRLDHLAREQIVTAMIEFRSGSRPGTLMPQLAIGYDDARIAAIADAIATGKRSNAR